MWYIWGGFVYLNSKQKKLLITIKKIWSAQNVFYKISKMWFSLDFETNERLNTLKFLKQNSDTFQISLFAHFILYKIS